MKYKEYNPNNNDMRTNYHLMISGIAPRPIAFVSSWDDNMNCNLAPFSFFNGFGANPPIVGFSPALSGRTGLEKDTLVNIRKTKEFTISIINSNMIEQASLASCEFKSDIDEFEKTGLDKHKSRVISVPGVANSPFIMECKLYKIIELGGKPGSGNLILGEIVFFHIDESIIDIDNKIDPYKIDQIGRAGGSWYTKMKKSLFSLKKPLGIGIGFDNIPKTFLDSELTGNQLAKLASIDSIPNLKSINNQSYSSLGLALSDIKECIKNNDIDKAWQIILFWEKNNG